MCIRDRNTTDGASFGFSSAGEHMIRIDSTGVFLANATIAGDLTVQGTTSSQGESESTDIVLTPGSAPSPTTNKLYNLSSGGLTFSGSKVVTTTATPGAAQIYFGDDNGDIITSSNCQFNLTSTNVLTNKSISGSSNTITNIPNSALSNLPNSKLDNSTITITGDGAQTSAVDLGDTLTIEGGTGITLSLIHI